jgi:hypothetical protein
LSVDDRSDFVSDRHDHLGKILRHRAELALDASDPRTCGTFLSLRRLPSVTGLHSGVMGWEKFQR